MMREGKRHNRRHETKRAGARSACLFFFLSVSFEFCLFSYRNKTTQIVLNNYIVAFLATTIK